MNKPLVEMYELVADEATFLQFVKALVEDRRNAVRMEKKKSSSPYGPDAGGWENKTIEDYLESAAAWADDSDFGRRTGSKECELADASPWRRMAAFLMAGRVYE